MDNKTHDSLYALLETIHEGNHNRLHMDVQPWVCYECAKNHTNLSKIIDELEQGSARLSEVPDDKVKDE